MTFNQSNHNAGDVHNHPGPEAPMAKAAATEAEPEAVAARKTRDPEAQAIDEINRAMHRLGRTEQIAVCAWFYRKHMKQFERTPGEPPAAPLPEVDPDSMG